MTHLSKLKQGGWRIKQIGFTFHADRCVGCKSCEIACRQVNIEHGGVRRRRVKKYEEISEKSINFYYLSLSCNHCINPECFRVCPNRVYQKRKTGVVTIKPERCNGCRRCIQACPFGVPQYNPITGRVDKCNLCQGELIKGNKPACVKACIMKSLQISENLYKNQHPWWPSTLPDWNTTQPSLQLWPPRKRERYYSRSEEND